VERYRDTTTGQILNLSEYLAAVGPSGAQPAAAAAPAPAASASTSSTSGRYITIAPERYRDTVTGETLTLSELYARGASAPGSAPAAAPAPTVSASSSASGRFVMVGVERYRDNDTGQILNLSEYQAAMRQLGLF
jgi:hypothetical protein